MTATARATEELVELLCAHAGDPRYFDCYNVMLDFDSTVLPLLHVMATCPGGERLRYEDVPSWDGLPELVDGGLPRMLEMFDEAFAYEKMGKHAPFDGAADTLRSLSACGVRFHVKTERPARFGDDVRRYLSDHHIHYASLRCDQPLDKVAECLAEDIHIAVDDHPRFIATASTAGIAVRTLGYGYNFEACAEQGIEASRDWSELYGELLAAVAARLLVELATQN